jgi:hypothetical protein
MLSSPMTRLSRLNGIQVPWRRPSHKGFYHHFNVPARTASALHRDCNIRVSTARSPTVTSTLPRPEMKHSDTQTHTNTLQNTLRGTRRGRPRGDRGRGRSSVIRVDALQRRRAVVRDPAVRRPRPPAGH